MLLRFFLRADSAGAVHGLLDWARENRVRFSVGFDQSQQVREAIGRIPDNAWKTAINQDGKPRENGEVTEITSMLDLAGWPAGSRAIVRRERPHPGAQLTFTDHEGHRFQAILTDRTDHDIALIELEHRARAKAENQIADMKDTGLANLPFRSFEMNQVWLEIAQIAHDLQAWTKTLLLEDELSIARPKRLRYQLLNIAGRLSFHARAARLHLQSTWPWAAELAAAFQKLRQQPLPTD